MLNARIAETVLRIQVLLQSLFAANHIPDVQSPEGSFPGNHSPEMAKLANPGNYFFTFIQPHEETKWKTFRKMFRDATTHI